MAEIPPLSDTPSPSTDVVGVDETHPPANSSVVSAPLRLLAQQINTGIKVNTDAIKQILAYMEDQLSPWAANVKKGIELRLNANLDNIDASQEERETFITALFETLSDEQQQAVREAIGAQRAKGINRRLLSTSTTAGRIITRSLSRPWDTFESLAVRIFGRSKDSGNSNSWHYKIIPTFMLALDPDGPHAVVSGSEENESYYVKFELGARGTRNITITRHSAFHNSPSTIEFWGINEGGGL